MIDLYFKRTCLVYEITGKEMSEVSGVSQSHISDFRSGKCSVTVDLFWKLLMAMEQIEPGSKGYFCALLAGASEDDTKDRSESFEKRLIDLIQAADDEEIEIALLTIAKRWRSSSSRFVKGQGSLTGVL